MHTTTKKVALFLDGRLPRLFGVFRLKSAVLTGETPSARDSFTLISRGGRICALPKLFSFLFERRMFRTVSTTHPKTSNKAVIPDRPGLDPGSGISIGLAALFWEILTRGEAD